MLFVFRVARTFLKRLAHPGGCANYLNAVLRFSHDYAQHWQTN